MAGFTIVRFRNMLRDTLDTTFVLLVLVFGMACGSLKFTTALIGLLVTTLALLYLWVTSFGSRHHYDLILNLHWTRPLAEIREVDHLLQRHTRRRQRASRRTTGTGDGTDVSYWLLLRDPARAEELLSEIRQVNGVARLTSIEAEDESEV